MAKTKNKNLMNIKNISLENIVAFLLTIYIFFSIFLPPLFPKKVIFILVLTISLIYVYLKKKLSLVIINPVIIFLFFLFYYCVGYTVQDGPLALQFLLLTVSLFIIFTVTEIRYDIEENLQTVSIIFSLLVIYMSMGFFSNFISIPIPFTDQLIAFFIDNKLGYIGFRAFGNFKPPMLHFISSPILLVPLLLLFDKLVRETKLKNFILFLIVLTAILLSGSRGIVAFSLIGIMLIYFYRVGIKTKLSLIFILALACAFIITNLETDFTLFSPTEKSNSVKVGHFISFIEQLNVKQVIVGDGLASLYYSVGFDKITGQTEVFLLDSIRYFGILGTLLFFLLLLIPMRLNNKNKITLIRRYKQLPILYLIFILYLLMSFTNPILLNSYGILVILWFWSKVLEIKEVV
ncbi:hypothetical protein [Colwellia sp. PAMC 20917]|uniref:hypothetical protein n=1 Tax=Colwellia sp. PAMC 20917 TaxID=1816218 RepID=UPI0012F8C2E3|nr:hypothetical protein [Colwellia sp. PAMC 20917]